MSDWRQVEWPTLLRRQLEDGRLLAVEQLITGTAKLTVSPPPPLGLLVNDDGF